MLDVFIKYKKIKRVGGWLNCFGFMQEAPLFLFLPS